MTFSSKIKNEISRVKIINMCCAKAELAALVRTTGYINLKGLNKLNVELATENAAVARRIFKLLKMNYNLSTKIVIEKSNRLKKRNIYIVKVEEDIVKKFLKDMGLIKNEKINLLNFDYGIPEDLIINECCKRSYIRGAFMGCGSISDPEKSYHGEFVNNKKIHGKDLCDIMSYYDIKAKLIQRKNYYVTYIKESEQISDLMNVMGAYSSLLDFENVRAVKETRNRINRVINCETANLDKIVDTSMRQINHIKILKKYKVINKLPPNLKELAYLRLEHNNASLKELGEMLDPPLGKSGVNHRLRKIEEIAKDFIERERGEKDEIAKSDIEK